MRLIDRQTNLLRHLTSQAFIFGTEGLGSAALDPDLEGMDVRRLRLEAEFSYSKRTKKLRQTFERTANLLGRRFPEVVRDFAAACPPRSYERYPDAKRFFDHFLERWAGRPPTPAWAADVAAVELALARARTFRPAAMEREALAQRPSPSPHLWRRTHPCAVLVRCGHDVRPLFESGRSGEEVRPRPLRLAVLASRGRRRPAVMELPPEAFALLEEAAEWSRTEPAAAGDGESPERVAAPGETAAPDSDARNALVRRLAAQGLMLAWDNDPGEESHV